MDVMSDRLLELLKILKEDFEMIQNGTWDITMSDGENVEASIDNIDEAIKIVEQKLRNNG